MKKVFSLIAFLLLLAVSLQTVNAAIPRLKLSKNENISLNQPAWKMYFGHTYAELLANPSLKGYDELVPQTWTFNGHPPKGYGTYVYRFTHDLPLTELVTLNIHSIGTAYDLFINGKKLTSVGRFGITEAQALPDYKPCLVSFEIEKDTVEIVLQVSNYHYREGGIYFAPTIGKHNELEASYFKTLFLSSFLFGALIVMFIYFFAFYYIKGDQISSLMFALLCLSAAIRIAVTSDILVRQIDLPISWEVLVKLEFSSIVLMLLFGYLYLKSFFPNKTNKKFTHIFIYVQSAIALFFALTPIVYSSEIINYFLFYCVCVLIYILYTAIRIFFQKKPFATWVGGTYLMLFCASINDVLYSLMYIDTMYVLPIGVFVFSIIQSITLTRLFSHTFMEVENLSAELVYTNKHQQEIISDRTSMLNAQAEELLRSNQIKDKVFSIIAHDLRTPIKSLGTVLNWVAEDELSFDDTKKSLASISKNVDNLNLTLENLLNWSLSQLNGVKAEPELIDIRIPVQEITELYKVQIAEKNITFNSYIQSRIAVFIDKHHLNLLLRNIISNAIKFTPNGGKIEVAAINYEGNFTLVSVKDSGVGMNESAMRKVFSDTEHITTYGTNNEKGTGLGLLLCKEYVENSKGKIWIESEEGKGTILFFTLPNYPL